MSRISNATYPKSAMYGSAGLWKGAESQGLDIPQDQYEVIDQAIAKALSTLTKSQSTYGGASTMQGVVAPKKFRIICEEIGFIPHTVKACIKGNMLHVIGLVEVPSESGPFTKEFKRLYHLPQHLNIDTDRLVKLFTERGQLIIEMPITESESYPAIGGARFGASNALEGSEPASNVYVVVNMAVKDEEKTFKPMGLPTTYNRGALDMSESSELPTSMTGWATSKRSVLPEEFEGKQPWNSQKFGKSSQYKSYGF
jgi:hypothetical protein